MKRTDCLSLCKNSLSTKEENKVFHFVYELIDPRTDDVVYIGITNNPNLRFQAHLSDTETNDKKGKWIEQLREESFEPRMKILEIVETREEAFEREKYWIVSGQSLALPQKK